MLEFLEKLGQLIISVLEIISDTANKIDSITFDQTIFQSYFGYFHYVVGSPTYEMFSTILLIAIGMSIWSFLLKGIGHLKNMLPW